MKRITLLIVVASAWSICGFSQAQPPLHLGMGTGWVLPDGYRAKPGPLFYLEPSYRVSSNFSVGLRTEYMMMQRGVNDAYVYASSFNLKRRGGGSATVNGQYYLSNGLFRPFLGVGVGVFFLTPYTEVYNNASDQTLASIQHEVSGGAKFGCYPKVGFMIGHFSFAAQYNTVFGNSSDTNTYLYVDKVAVSRMTVSNTTINDYLSCTVGFLW